MLEKKSYPVERILTHIAPHSDELDALELALMEGRDVFPGIGQAPVRLIDAGLHDRSGQNGNDRLIAEKTLCIGVNGGEFDEHGVPADKRQSHTAFSRMAVWLGLQDRPAIKTLIDYSLRMDRVVKNRTFKGSFEIPYLVKAWWVGGWSLAQVRDAYHIIFQATYRNLSGQASVAEPARGEFRKMIANWFVLRFAKKGEQKELLNRFTTGEEAALFLGQIREDVRPMISLDIRDTGVVGPKHDFEIEGVWEAMVRTGVPPADRARIIFASLNAKYIEQVAFLAACEEFKAKASDVKSEKHPYSVVVVRSDSGLMNRAVRFTDPDVDVLIQISSDNRYKVFDLHMRLNMAAVAMYLRIAENEQRGRRDRIPIEQLLADGTLTTVPECFFWEEGHGIFNGTHTARSTPVTSLFRRRIVTAVEKGLAFAEDRFRVFPNALNRKIKQQDKDRRKVERDRRDRRERRQDPQEQDQQQE
jgi:hypothetical protein